MDRDANDHVYCTFEFPGPGYEKRDDDKFYGYADPFTGVGGKAGIKAGGRRRSLTCGGCGMTLLPTPQSGCCCCAAAAAAAGGDHDAAMAAAAAAAAATRERMARRDSERRRERLRERGEDSIVTQYHLWNFASYDAFLSMSSAHQ